jgi:hypothetical protein
MRTVHMAVIAKTKSSGGGLSCGAIHVPINTAMTDKKGEKSHDPV